MSLGSRDEVQTSGCRLLVVHAQCGVVTFLHCTSLCTNASLCDLPDAPLVCSDLGGLNIGAAALGVLSPSTYDVVCGGGQAPAAGRGRASSIGQAPAAGRGRASSIKSTVCIHPQIPSSFRFARVPSRSASACCAGAWRDTMLHAASDFHAT
jgi:hypothetical protein